MKYSIKKIVSLLLIIGLNWSGISLIAGTDAYFNDVEMSEGNTMAAGTLDFSLTSQNASGFAGMENNGEIFHTSVAIPESGSMPMRYFAYSASASLACSEFRVKVKQNETEIFNGPLPDFLSATTTVFGTWKFEFDLPVGASVTQGDLCQANITFSAWREEIENPEESGFFDIEILSLNLKAKTIVLNEVLAYPNPSHSYPANREFIELKNNGNAPVDVAGWKVSEMTSGGVENKYTITTAGGSYTASPYGGSTIIPAGGWLVLLLSDGTALNNNGDTIRLYDNSGNKLDEYSYEVAKYGLSDARYLDGIGEWVDPVPTPGGMNEIEENLIIAGLDNLIVGDGGLISPEPIIPEPISEPIIDNDTDNMAGDGADYTNTDNGDIIDDGAIIDDADDDIFPSLPRDWNAGDDDGGEDIAGDTDDVISDGANGSTQEYGANEQGGADAGDEEEIGGEAKPEVGGEDAIESTPEDRTGGDEETEPSL